MSNTIIRARRRHRFVILDQRAVEDSRLSWAARGLLAYLLSRPDDWRVLINDLRKRGDQGRDGIYKLLRELREAGYVRFQRSRDAQDRIRGGTYLVQEIPGSPHPDLPDTAEPDTAEPDTAEPDTAEPDTAAPDPVKPKALLNTDLDLIPTTTTIPTTTKGGSCCSEPEADRIEFAAWVPDDLKEPAINKVARLDTSVAQIIIDEWAGSMATGRIERSPLGYLQALVSRLESGRFRLQYADEVEAIRKGEDRTATG